MAFKINKSRLEFVVLMALAILSSPHLAALADPMKDQEHFRQLILNGICCVPNLSSGATAVHLKNGKGVNNSDRVTMGKIAVGELNGKPAAIAVISNQGGGSGIFVSLLLYEMHAGKAVTVGSYSVGDRAVVEKLSFASNQIHLVSKDTIGEESGKTKTINLSKQEFDRTECIAEALSPRTKLELNELTDVYRKVFADGSLTLQDRQTALRIFELHKADRAHFADLFRLTIQSLGYGQACEPLAFDAAGHPVLQIDDKEKGTRKITLQTDK
jgi:hypothetical protein